MIAQSAEWEIEQDKPGENRSLGDEFDVAQEVVRSKLGAARGIGLGLLAGAACWAAIIWTIVHFR